MIRHPPLISPANVPMNTVVAATGSGYGILWVTATTNFNIEYHVKCLIMVMAVIDMRGWLAAHLENH
jgi:hypothetical protein